MLRTLVCWLTVASVAGAQAPALDSLRHRVLHQHDARAAMHLADAYFTGTGGATAHTDSAYRYLRIAAADSLPEAMYLLGVGRVRGAGIKKDIPGGLKLLHAASQHQNRLALKVLIELYADSAEYVFNEAYERVRPDRRLAYGYAVQLAALHDVFGALHAGRSCLYGWGTPRHDSAAVAYLTASATGRPQGYVEAQFLLGHVWYYGLTSQGVNLETAERFYRMAAQHPTAPPEFTLEGKVGLFNIMQTRRRVWNLHQLMMPQLAPYAPQLWVNP